ncbi:hypothetical protein OH540_14635 [Streptomyces sp. BPPL-273]|uniref:hypothetical protein n=1 Tax=Streptomyces sp. BPPL-273 TaxID=2987533 RepID=UPI0024AE9756|nr:hypothetical protein [Streptomyces sp. BPPL-273]WHM31218.1 hypothetical protein OH540_14635 [Streptomyces sp. BPPL-273]
MIWSAASPGAALRVTRTAAGRRALHVALLVGGLFVLGLLCGERAHAADGTPSRRDAVRQAADLSPVRTTAGGREAKGAGTNGPGPKDRTAEDRKADDRRAEDRTAEDRTAEDRTAEDRSPEGPAPESLTPAGLTSPPLPRQSPHPVSDLVRSVTDQVVRPVAGVVDVVEETVERLPLPATPSGGGSVTHPGSSDPTEPPLSPWPSLPALPGLPAPSGDAASDGPAAPAVPAAPHHRRPAPAETAAPSDVAEARPATTRPATADVTGAVTDLPYGPAPVAVDGGPETRTPLAGDGGRRTTATPAEYAPTGHAPTGAPDGSLGSAAGADQGMPRHGDAHAVTPHHRMPFRLVIAVPERADTGETRDPYRDIPVSPA